NASLHVGLCPTEPLFQVVVIVVGRHERIPEGQNREAPNFVRRRHLAKDMPDRRVRKMKKTEFIRPIRDSQASFLQKASLMADRSFRGSRTARRSGLGTGGGDRAAWFRMHS